MLNNIFDNNDATLYKVDEREDGSLEYVLDLNNEKITLSKLSNIDFDKTTVLKDIIDSKSSTNKYDKDWFASNSGEYPIFTGSQDIAAYIYPKDENDIINKTSLSYNKDNDKGSKVFFHNKPYIIGGHHYSLFIKEDLQSTISIKYLYYILMEHFNKVQYFQSQLPVANIGIIEKINISIPNNIDSDNSLLKISSIQLQRAIAKYIEEKMKRIEEQNNTIDIMLSLLKIEKEKITDNIFINGSQRIRIGDFLIKDYTKIQIDDNSLYTRVTVRMNNLGTKIRDREYGINIGTKEQFLIKEGQFILSKIDARNGAFGMVTKEIDGAIVTNDFPSYNIDTSKISIDFLLLFTSSTEFIRICGVSSRGVTGRKRVKEDILLNIEIALPDIKEQEMTLKTINQQFKIMDTRKDSLLIMKELLRIGREKVLKEVLYGN